MSSKRDRNHAHAVAMLGSRGYNCTLLSSPTVRPQDGREIIKGYPDITFIRNGIGGYIECKYDKNRFSFKSWGEEQRNWAEWARDWSGNEYWIYLTLGPGHSAMARNGPKRTWLVPYPKMLEIEALVSPYQDSLVYEAGKGMKREIQDNRLDAIHLLADFELYWRTGLTWMPDISHAFYRMYIEHPGLPLYPQQQETANVRSDRIQPKGLSHFSLERIAGTA